MVRPSGRLSTKLRRAPTRYALVSRIASGGMAEVWRADAVFEDGQKQPVAIKRVLPELVGQQVYRSMFEDEARLGMLLRHPNIVRVYDAREVGGSLIMVMELVDGAALKTLLESAHARAACMPVPVALHIAREIARALDYAHTAQDATGKHLGIVHRDVSPHNILLGKDGTVKLTDFGLADASVHETARSEEIVGGKLGYLAPEVVLQKRAPAHKVDVFALGIVLWEMLAGRRLFQGVDDAETVRNVVRMPIPNVSQLNQRVPRAVDEIVAKLLDRNPDKRISRAGILVEQLEQMIASIEPRVGAKDVALVVRLHTASVPTAAPPPVSATQFLANELDAFARIAAGSDYDLGGKPLDPTEFAGPMSSGVRERPSEDPIDLEHELEPED